MKTLRDLNLAGRAFLLAAVVLSAVACASTSSAEGPQLLFVQSADSIEVDAAGSTFRLVNVNQQTLYFSDRPYRIAGHIKMADYLEEWTSKAGKDNFTTNPPNATLSVYEPGQSGNVIAVVEITKPVADGADLVYGYKVIDGKMPANGGATSLFIDRIGVGGGVGRGFHGVGVGRRGPGVR